MRDGTVWCWGNNLFGSLGAPVQANQDPVLVEAVSRGVLDVSVGGYTSSVRLYDGTILEWGGNFHGENNTWTARKVDAIPRVARVVRSNVHVCAIDFERQLWCWGENWNGGLGDGTTVDNNQPRPVVGMSDVADVALGSLFTCSLATSGVVSCWGQNNQGQLGDGTTTERHTPAPVPGLDEVAQLSAALDHACARHVDGRVSCWGESVLGHFNDLVPTAVPGLRNVVDVSVGYYHVCVLQGEGVPRMLCWGVNLQGQLGDGTFEHRSEPTPVVWPWQ